MFEQKKIWTDQSIFGRCRAQKVQVTGQKGDLQYLTSRAQVGQRSKMLLIRKGCRIGTNAFQAKSPNHNTENEVLFRIKKIFGPIGAFSAELQQEMHSTCSIEETEEIS